MEIKNITIIDDFCRKHADAAEPMNQWMSAVEVAQWKNPHELKAEFPTADCVGNRHYVFDIKGNTYRLITVIVFFDGMVDIRFVGTHAEYDKLNKTKNIKEI
jgi:mRNA interferase HigB